MAKASLSSFFSPIQIFLLFYSIMVLAGHGQVRGAGNYEGGVRGGGGRRRVNSNCWGGIRVGGEDRGVGMLGASIGHRAILGCLGCRASLGRASLGCRLSG